MRRLLNRRTKAKNPNKDRTQRSSCDWLSPCVLILFALVGWSATRSTRCVAQPVVHVQAETRFELLYQHQEDRVEGALRDDLGQGLGDRPIRIAIQAVEPRGNSRTQRLVTMADGTFTLALRPGVQRWRIRIEFSGDSLYAPVRAERELNSRLADVQLRIDIDESIDLDADSIGIVIAAASAAGTAGLQITLSDEFGREFGNGTIGAGGTLGLSLPGDSFGGMGPGRIRAESLADETRSSSRSERPILRIRRAGLLLERTERGLSSDAVHLHGRLSDSDGPLTNRAIDIYRDEDLAFTVLTGEGGRFLWSATDLNPGPHRFHASFQSDTPGRPDARSESVDVLIQDGGLLRQVLYLFALLLAALVAWGVRRSVSRPALSSSAPPPAAPRLQLGKSSIRQRSSMVVTGRIQDCDSGLPIAEAALSLKMGADGDPLPGSSDEDGHFRFTGSQPGVFLARFSASGYEPLLTEITLPHRGEWSTALVSLRSLRQAALAPYREIARDHLSRPAAWNVKTNLEVADATLGPIFGETRSEDLAGLVDNAVYGPEPPTHHEIGVIQERIEEMRGQDEKAR